MRETAMNVGVGPEKIIQPRRAGDRDEQQTQGDVPYAPE